MLATGRYLGEGFDDPTLDTLFLTMPISWKGTLAQYVGRLHREHHAKQEVIVFDYVDFGMPMFLRMALKRQSGYRSLGYSPRYGNGDRACRLNREENSRLDDLLPMRSARLVAFEPGDG